jgi:hypothetical protein
MIKRKKIKIICEECEKGFLKIASEVNRNQRTNSRNFCSRSCAASHRNRNFTERSPHIAKWAKNRLDGFTAFRRFIRRAKCRCVETGMEFDLDLVFLKNLWEQQEHRCTYSKILLCLPNASGRNNRVTTASLDRINSKEGYVKSNVHYVSVAINFLKCDMSHEETIQLCQQIAKNLNGEIAQ